MGATSIEWCDVTFNPWWGCSRVSPGCEHCYAEALAKRTGRVRWGVHEERRPTSEAYWRGPVKWNAAAEREGVRRRVFCASMADVFEDLVELVEPRARLWELIRSTPALDWLLLTKRPENIGRLLPRGWIDLGPWPNVWLGTTVEDQRRAEERIPELVAIPARLRFLSCEPLLEAVDLTRVPGFDAIGWVIIGGESGGGARPFNTAWASSLIAQCRAVGAAPFVKQLGARALEPNRRSPALVPVPIPLRSRKGGDPSEWPEAVQVREFPRC